MKKLLFVAVIMLATTANAQTIGGLGDEFNSLSAQLPGLNAIMSETTDANIGLKKEYDVYIADQKQKKDALEVAKAEVIRTVKTPLEQEVTSTVNEYNGRCNRQFNRDTEMGQYNQCLSDKDRIENWRAGKIAWWKQYSENWDKANVDPINAVILKQNARITQIDAQMKANFKRYTDAQDRFIAAKTRIDAILGQIKLSCANKPAPAGGQFTYNEWVKWCSNVDWDGANRKLPPMYKWQGTGGASTN
jgi:hypothetical protein